MAYDVFFVIPAQATIHEPGASYAGQGDSTIRSFGMDHVFSCRKNAHAWAIIAGLCLTVIYKVGVGDGTFPESWQYSLREEIDDFADWMSATFAFILNPVGDAVDIGLRKLEVVLLWIPWIAVIAATFLVALRVSGPALAMFSLLSLLYIGCMGLWNSTIATFALIGSSVVAAALIGIPLGICAARSDRFEGLLRPLLDAMQTMPTFVYLIPVLVLFGFGRPSALLATVIFAAPPIIRLTNLGIRQVAPEAVDAARSFGSTSRQLLYKVQLPLAKPSILMGLNQTIMMALGMVIIVVLIGAPGLGKDVWLATKRVDVGLGLEAGLAVVLLAIILDRTSYAFSRRDAPSIETEREPGRFTIELLSLEFLRTTGNRWFLGVSTVVVVLCLVLGRSVEALSDFPRPDWIHFRGPVNALVDWMNVHLGTITNLIHVYVFIYGLKPVKELVLWMPWPVLIFVVAWLAHIFAGRRVAVFCVLGLLYIGVVGMWAAAAETFSLVAVAVGLSVLAGVPLGILASRSDLLSAILRPILDTMQTLPAFVYLPLVIMLFKTGPVAGVVATVIYAMPPAVRLTNLGIREVPFESVEAAGSFGSSPLQTLLKVELPLALPSVMLGINQTIILGVGMAVYASLIGAPGLGLEILEAIGRFDIGWGFESGVSVVILAIVIDRITQGMSRSRAR